MILTRRRALMTAAGATLAAPAIVQTVLGAGYRLGLGHDD